MGGWLRTSRARATATHAGGVGDPPGAHQPAPRRIGGRTAQPAGQGRHDGTLPVASYSAYLTWRKPIITMRKRRIEPTTENDSGLDKAECTSRPNTAAWNLLDGSDWSYMIQRAGIERSYVGERHTVLPTCNEIVTDNGTGDTSIVGMEELTPRSTPYPYGSGTAPDPETEVAMTLRRMTVPVAVGLLGLTVLGCKSDGSPTEPDQPRAISNSTVLANLPQIIELERAERQDSRLVRITGGAGPDGTLLAGSAWTYIFHRFDAQVETRFVWKVWSDGRITFRGPEPPLTRDSFEHLPDLIRLDSDELVQLALDHGGDRYMERFPDAHISMEFYVLAGIPTCEMQFRSLNRPPGTGFCEPEIWIDAASGDLLLKEGFDCVDEG